MDIQIIRNTSASFQFKADKLTQDSLKSLFENGPKLTEEQQKMLDENNRQLEELERQIWEYLSQHPRTDLDGDLITRDTHEIGFETEYEDIDGCTWAVAKQIYIQPKKSIYDKKRNNHGQRKTKNSEQNPI